ncbi:Aster-C-like [Homarus americanus]|uniref:Aster-C-like n=1 Tax=Homarus americanus TaxID=6706 RepID=A0A8J5JSG6_HOMAM|nr:Aster-C-like [Homarus americanus]
MVSIKVVIISLIEGKNPSLSPTSPRSIKTRWLYEERWQLRYSTTYACRLCYNEGVPSDQEGVPSDQERVPSDQEGVPSDQEGVPSDQEGVPSDQEGVPSDQEGVPKHLEITQHRTPPTHMKLEEVGDGEGEDEEQEESFYSEVDEANSEIIHPTPLSYLAQTDPTRGSTIDLDGRENEIETGSRLLEVQHQGKEVINSFVHLPVDTVFNLVFLHDRFMADVLSARKVTGDPWCSSAVVGGCGVGLDTPGINHPPDIMKTPWQEQEDGRRVREVTYTMSLSISSITSKASNVVQESRAGYRYVVETEVFNTGIPHGDDFTVLNYYCFTSAADHTTIITEPPASESDKVQGWAGVVVVTALLVLLVGNALLYTKLTHLEHLARHHPPPPSLPHRQVLLQQCDLFEGLQGEDNLQHELEDHLDHDVIYDQPQEPRQITNTDTLS